MNDNGRDHSRPFACGLRDPALIYPGSHGLTLTDHCFGHQTTLEQTSEIMARRFSSRYQLEPVSALATWARSLAVFAAVTAIVSMLVVRFDFLEPRPGLTAFLGALCIACLSIIFALGGFAAIWQNGTRGIGRLLVALLLDGLVLAYPAYLAVQYKKHPAIHDVTTDAINPPRLDALARLRTDSDSNSAVYAGLYSAEQQRLAYPDVKPLEFDIPVQRAFDLTAQILKKRKWLIIDERRPLTQSQIGRFEAIDRTMIMGFREDIAIRIAPDGEGSRVDIRSSSRHFKSDLGSNASRILALAEDLTKAVDDATAPKKAPVPTNAQVKAPAPKR